MSRERKWPYEIMREKFYGKKRIFFSLGEEPSMLSKLRPHFVDKTTQNLKWLLTLHVIKRFEFIIIITYYFSTETNKQISVILGLNYSIYIEVKNKKST